MNTNHVFGTPSVLFEGGAPKSFHTFQPCHTTEIQEINMGGFTYWSYYTLGGSNLAPPFEIHLARSNSLTSGWVDYGKVYDGRWPSVHFDGSNFHMFYRENSANHVTYRATSADGITWADAETIGNGANPFLWKNPNDNQWYLFSSDLGGNGYQIFYRTAATITGLAASAKTYVIDQNVHVAAPSIFYRNGLYHLFVEEDAVAYWRIVSLTSSNIAGPYTRTDIVSVNDEACPIILKGGATLYYYSCPLVSSRATSYWNIALRTITY